MIYRERRLTPRQIAESFRRFGISDDSTNVLAMKVSGDPAEIEAHLKQFVEGELVPLTDEVLVGMCDLGRIRKLYRVDAGSARKDAEAFVLGSMALKGS